MAKRTKQDSTPDQVTPEGEPIVNPEAQFPDVPPVINEGNPPPPEGHEAAQTATAALPGSGLPPYGHWSREGELASIRASDRPDPTEPPGESPPIEEGRQDINPVQQTGTDRHYAPPADAKAEDVEAARGPDQSEAPAPFRRRDGFPDITTETVQVRMTGDYYPADPSRYGNQLRARKGQLVSFGPDEALALIDAGLAERVDDESVGFQQDLPQPGEEPRPQGFLPVVNQETGVPEAPENPGSIDPSKAQSPSSPPDYEGLKASQEGQAKAWEPPVQNVPEGQTVDPEPGQP